MRSAASSPPPVAERSPLRGLSRRELPFVPVFAQSVAAIAPSGTAVVTPAFVIGAAGGGASVAAFLAAAVLAWGVALVIRPMAQRLAVSGGLYTYVAKGLGPAVAVPVGWSAIVGYASVSVAGLMAVGTYLDQIAVTAGLAGFGGTATIIALLLGAAVVAAVLMVRGIRLSASATLLVECVSVVTVLALMGYLLTRDSRGPFGSAGAHTAFEWHGGTGTLAMSAVVAVSAFVGFESATTLSAEAYRPFRSVPRTLAWTPLAAAVIYLIAVSAQAVALASAPLGTASSSTPVTDLLLQDNSRFLGAVLDLGVAASFFACTVASINALVRVLFTMGREGIAPAAAGRAHPRFHTPAPAIVAAVGAVTVGAVGYLLSGAEPQDGIRSFLTLSALGYLGSYLPACLATPALLRRIGESSRGMAILGPVTATLLGVLMVAAAVTAGNDSVTVVIAYAAVLVTAAVFTAALRVFTPDRLRGIGIYDEPQRADLLPTVTFR
ncbi:APC family permease [Nocardia aurantiaca]|uniref:Amino acid permease n=1 Tax=Nocardia aurantiaca TaxID=2675850 RepID=A0A6I3KYM1_9NOCA|nr:APC family permease [Nocardia aurantiaca]MTE13620.1 amino acid permease [Nocardia aurantiaca]